MIINDYVTMMMSSLQDGLRSGVVSPKSRVLSVVAEAEERATPTEGKGVWSAAPTTGVWSVNREESTQSEGEDDTLPLI